MDASTRSNQAPHIKLLHRQREAYDEAATVWDQNSATQALAHFTLLIKEKVNPGALILDADADMAERTLALLQHCRPSEVIALVASEAMLDVAKAEMYDSRVRFLQGDVRHLPFAENTFDVVAGQGWIGNCSGR